jgi:selenocysteine-specific elongation factor
VAARSRLEASQAESALRELLLTNSLIPLEDGDSDSASDRLVMAAPHWNTLRENVLQIVQDYHRSYPLRRGIPREELKSRLKLSARAFQALVAKCLSQNLLKDSDKFLAAPAHEVTFDAAQQRQVQALMRRFEQNPFSPPGSRELQQEVGDEVLNALIASDELFPVSSDVVFRRQDYELMIGKIRQHLQQHGRITLAEVRDLFSTSRKYAQALLEHLDSIGVTSREGDFRTLKSK